jgi:hypothetical protein
MQYVESPKVLVEHNSKASIFLAGGITGCWDWQKEIVYMLENTDIVLLNPRRKDFPTHDSSAAIQQITWEYEHLRKADAIIFWFSHETLCPIVLFELGSWLHQNKPIFVGTHPEYARKHDIEIQLGLARPDLKVVYSLNDLAEQVKTFLIH